MNLFFICGRRHNEGKSWLMYAIDFSFNCNCYFPEGMFGRSWVSVGEMAPDILQSPSENNQKTCVRPIKPQSWKKNSGFTFGIPVKRLTFNKQIGRKGGKVKTKTNLEAERTSWKLAGIVCIAVLLSCFTNYEVRGVGGGCNSPYGQPCSARDYESHNAMHWWRSHKARPRLITIPLSLTYLTMSHRIHRLWLGKLSQQSSVILRNNQMDMGPQDGHAAVIPRLMLSGNKLYKEEDINSFSNKVQ